MKNVLSVVVVQASIRPGQHRFVKGSENLMKKFLGECQRNEFESASKPFFIFISKSEMLPSKEGRLNYSPEVN
jgi:hypothetical protein